MIGEILLITLVVFIVVAAIAILFKRKSVARYESRKYLMTPAERSFYGVLKTAIGHQYEIFSKVRMGDVLQVRKGLDSKKSLIARSKIQQKHFDFVLCAKDTLGIVCCIELNDRSHEKQDRQKRDAFVRDACTQANVPLLEFQAKAYYNTSTIQDLVLSALDQQPVSNIPSSTHTTTMDSKTTDLISTTKIAKRHGISTGACQVMLVELGFIESVPTDGIQKFILTQKGLAAGGATFNHPLYGEYCKWPHNILGNDHINDQNGHFNVRSLA